MLDFFRNYNKYKQMEIDNSKNNVEQKTSFREKIIYCVMIIFCLIGMFINFKNEKDNFLLNHKDLIILLILLVIYMLMKLKKKAGNRNG